MLTRQTIDAVIAAVLESQQELEAGDAATIANYAASEVAFARVVTGRLLAMTPEEVTREVANPCYHRAAVAMTLLDAYDANSYRWKPKFSLAVVEAAVTISAALPVAIAALTCRALKEKGNALRLLGHFDEANAVLALAMQSAEATQVPDLHRAIVEHAMAAVACESRRPYDALKLLAAARSKFEGCGEAQRAKATRSLEASVLYSLSRFAEALDLYNASLADAIAANDEESTACEIGNIAHCCARMGETVAARGYFGVAAEMYESIGLIVPRAKMLRSLGRLAVRERGVDAESEMRAAWETFDDLGMVGESALTRLALVEELLDFDPASDVSGICRDVFELSLSAGMDTVAATALGLLVDLARQGLATPEFVREVSGCVDSKLTHDASPAN